MDKKLLNYFKGDELAASTWLNKYAAPREETPDDTHKRLAKEFARIEAKYPIENQHADNRLSLSSYGYYRFGLTEEIIYNMFKDFKYIIPGGSVMAGCGTNQLVSLSNCFVIGSPKDSYAEIMKTRNYQAQLMKRRGGVGYDLSELRPRGAAVNNAAKTSTGAASFMDVCSDITNEVAQNGRRGALMLSMNINHPDVEEFITKKQDLTKVTGANISVKVTDEFMHAVENHKDYLLRYPVNMTIDNDIENFQYDKLISYNGGYVKRIKADELWKLLMHCAWNTAEPGIIFEDTMHKHAPDGVYPGFGMVSTNPCGEIPMGPYDSCRLIHVNLSSFINDPFTDHAELNTQKLYEISYEAMRLADDLVDLEIEAVDRIINIVKDDEDPTEFNLWSKIKETAVKGRRAGLGFTGLADALAMLNLKYDSKEALQTVSIMMQTMFKGELDSTIDLSIERGPFPEFNSIKESYSNGINMIAGNSWYKWLKTTYPDKFDRMHRYGRRNISWSTVAPTGTVSIMAGCSSGIEPIFLPFYTRKRKCMSKNDRIDFTDKLGENYTLFVVVHPTLKRWAKEFCDNYSDDWVIDDWEKAFIKSPYYGSTAPEIDWRNRVQLQGVVQKYITHSISSTINLPKNTTEEEIADIYLEAWRHKNKGQTIYRDGCRDGVLTKIETPKVIENRQAPKRPKTLDADFYQIKVKGEKFIVLVGLLDNKPYEVFAFKPEYDINIPDHKGKITKVKKMHYKFISDLIEIPDLQLVNSNVEEKAATLYSSMLLRHGVDIEYIIKTAKKVNDNISSFSSAMCRILSKYIGQVEMKEVCPECGGRLIRDGGCIHCMDCDYSRCS